MYWKIEILTKTGNQIVKTVEGEQADIRHDAEFEDIEILSLSPDYLTYFKSVLSKRRLSTSTLATFFTDFSRTQKGGLSFSATVDSLKETCNDQVLKEALVVMNNAINDGRSFKDAFENAKCFPRIVVASMAAAEKSGSVPKICEILSKYFKFNNDVRKKVIGALIYPALIFVALTVASIIISTTLIPQLGNILPPSSMDDFSVKVFLAYAAFMKNYWWLAATFPVLIIILGGYFWREHRDKIASQVYKIPLLGQVLKEIEFARLFLNLYVYQKSGIPIIETITNIYKDDKSFINERLLNIRNQITKGASLGDAFKSDDFFPAFIWHNLSKGQKTGDLVNYLEETYTHYDLKSKDSINVLVNLVHPTLLLLAVSFLAFIVITFFMPIYKNMAVMGGVFK